VVEVVVLATVLHERCDAGGSSSGCIGDEGPHVIGKQRGKQRDVFAGGVVFRSSEAHTGAAASDFDFDEVAAGSFGDSRTKPRNRL